MKPTKQVGRPLRFNAKIKRAFVKHVANGAPVSHILRAMRISPTTLSAERRRDKEFDSDIEAAISERLLKSLEYLQQQKDWRCVAFLLQNQHPEFQKNRGHQVNVSVEKAVFILPEKQKIPAELPESTNAEIIDATSPEQ